MQNSHHYKQIANSIQFILLHFKAQPSLDEIAAHVNMSPFHFQKLFSEWAGISPKKFLQFITLHYAKSILKNTDYSVDATAIETGLSGSSRLHDLFVNIERMTPGEFKNAGESLAIEYNFVLTLFGKLFVASTQKGICYIAFAEDEAEAIFTFKNIYQQAKISKNKNSFHQQIVDYFDQRLSFTTKINLHLRGTDFQIKVWEMLLKIPAGNLTTYGQLAASIHKPTASRAVGTAVGDNPVAYLIPCHRVIQSSGIFGQYHWGPERKAAMIAWEAAQLPQQNDNLLFP